MAVSPDGELLLTPLATIPKRELIVWENQMLRESLAAGLRQAAAGERTDVGSFARWASNDEAADTDGT